MYFFASEEVNDYKRIWNGNKSCIWNVELKCLFLSVTNFAIRELIEEMTLIIAKLRVSKFTQFNDRIFHWVTFLGQKKQQTM